jgi:hypothetical protein
MGSRENMKASTFLRNYLCQAIAFGLVTLGLLSLTAWAKEPSLMVIELYDGSAGAAYIQLQNVLINGKTEMRECALSGTAPMDKSAYNKLEKLVLAPGGVLERGDDGVLRYSAAGAKPVCVAPANIKFEHSESLSPAAMAESIQFRGDPVAPGSDGATTAPPLKNRVKLVVVAAPNVELAEFFLAQRVANVGGWKNYLVKYPASPHTDEAKDTLTALYVEAGEKALSEYQKSPGTGAQPYSELKEAKAQEDQAHALRANFKSSVQLAEEIDGKLQALTDKGRAELEAYNAALAAHSPGYAHLLTAKALAEGVAGVDPVFSPGVKLLADVVQARNAYESALQSAASAAAAKQMDAAFQFVLPYRAFAEEDPRVAQVIDATYEFHFERGQLAGQGQDWATAINEYEKAASTKDTADARDALKDARVKFAIAQDEVAAKLAVGKSQEYEAQKDFVNAYEVLSNLTASQQKVIAGEMTRLAPEYVQAASDKAKVIVKNYPDIKGIEDERQIELAYALLQNAYKLSDDDAARASYQTRFENLGDKLSEWFLDRAKHFLDKPAGSFTEVGWAYLKEAESYKATNLDQVRDASTAAAPAHAMHSKLSIRVHVLDQTSLRESTGLGFVRQLEDAIITKLEEYPNQVKAIRFGDPASGGDPDFQLEGNVLEHEVITTPKVVSMPSHYRSGTHQEINQEWIKANRESEDAKEQLQSDETDLAAANAKNNKKDIAAVTQRLNADKKRISEAETKRDSLLQNKTVDDIREYQYTQKTLEIRNIIKLQFTVSRTQSGTIGPPTVVEREEPGHFVQIEDVKPDDVDGVRLDETNPDTRAMQTALENKVRDELKEKVAAKLAELPKAIYAEAKSRAKEENLEDAGEAYLRYLSVTPAEQTPERLEAEKFLTDQFNFPTFPSLAP